MGKKLLKDQKLKLEGASLEYPIEKIAVALAGNTAEMQAAFLVKFFSTLEQQGQVETRLKFIGEFLSDKEKRLAGLLGNAGQRLLSFGDNE